jgi:hypothetical protein
VGKLQRLRFITAERRALSIRSIRHSLGRMLHAGGCGAHSSSVWLKRQSNRGGDGRRVGVYATGV